MRLISLNTWGGKLAEPLFSFLEREREQTDVFCFQEVHMDASALNHSGEREHLYGELCNSLTGHEGFFAEQHPGTGIATFVHKSIPVGRAESMCVLATEEMQEPFYSRPLQHLVLPEVHIFNFHGVPRGGKRDNPDRDKQTARVLERMSKENGPKILMGDFNLLPDTEAIHLFEKTYRNLVIEGGFTTTRTEHYAHRVEQPYADYTFVSSEVRVRHFEVMPDIISDHMAMCIEFE